jgi:hypothetical protein
MAGAVARCQKSDKTFPPVTAHDLRHTAASLAIASGANPKVVQRMLGHAPAAMTLDVYADLFDSDFIAVADKLSEMQLPTSYLKLWAKCGHGEVMGRSSKHGNSVLTGLMLLQFWCPR